MQMNGFSLKQMGYFSCFRTMFVRHDLRNFIPREREGERGGGRERGRDREKAGRGGGVGLGIQGRTKFYTGRLWPEVKPLTLLYPIFVGKGTFFVYLLVRVY